MKSTEVRWACVIVAAGAGERFGGGTPKQFRLLRGRPVVEWSLATALSVPGVEKVVVVLPRGASWRPPDDPRIVLAEGGPARGDSVRNGLALAVGCTHVLVHDAARPWAGAGLFERVMEAALESGAAVPVAPVPDTVKVLEAGMAVRTLDRSVLGLSQTPQGFSLPLLAAALSDGSFTDESAALEGRGIPVRAVEGEASNIKITFAGDMPRSSSCGTGIDFHPFREDRPLVLCGCRLSDRGGLDGHSDGDAALHAVTDAVLAASRLGDIGTLYPPGDPATAGADSADLLAGALAMARDAGWSVESVDLTIIGERPRIAPMREAMVARLAGLCGDPPGGVWVKGTTTNTLGDIGRGAGLGAFALVTMYCGGL